MRKRGVFTKTVVSLLGKLTLSENIRFIRLPSSGKLLGEFQLNDKNFLQSVELIC